MFLEDRVTKIDVLIVGAGPAGLALARFLKGTNLSFCIIDRLPEKSTLSKATGIHRNTMRLLHQLGLSDAIMSKSILLNQMYQYKDFSLVKEEVFAQGSLFFDKNLSINQHELESILSENLAFFVRGAELVSFERVDEKISSTIQVNSQRLVI